jgi:hypothetical protein
VVIDVKGFLSSFNVEINGFRIDDVAEKIGALFGEEGRAIGKKIDDLTKDKTIKIENDKKK